MDHNNHHHHHHLQAILDASSSSSSDDTTTYSYRSDQKKNNNTNTTPTVMVDPVPNHNHEELLLHRRTRITRSTTSTTTPLSLPSPNSNSCRSRSRFVVVNDEDEDEDDRYDDDNDNDFHDPDLIEQLLRESDDDEKDDDDDRDHDFPLILEHHDAPDDAVAASVVAATTTTTRTRTFRTQPKQLFYPHDRTAAKATTSTPTPPTPTSTPTRAALSYRASAASHNAQDWAILQAILQEEEEEDESESESQNNEENDYYQEVDDDDENYDDSENDDEAHKLKQHNNNNSNSKHQPKSTNHWRLQSHKRTGSTGSLSNHRSSSYPITMSVEEILQDSDMSNDDDDDHNIDHIAGEEDKDENIEYGNYSSCYDWKKKKELMNTSSTSTTTNPNDHDPVKPLSPILSSSCPTTPPPPPPSPRTIAAASTTTDDRNRTYTPTKAALLRSHKPLTPRSQSRQQRRRRPENHWIDHHSNQNNKNYYYNKNETLRDDDHTNGNYDIIDHTGNHNNIDVKEEKEEETSSSKSSQMHMAIARAYERKLLKSGHREIVSPLMVKRRLKPKIEMSVRGGGNSGSGGRIRKKTLAAAASPERRTTTAATTTTPRFGFSGRVENTPMLEVSRSIAAHVQPIQPTPPAAATTTAATATATAAKVHTGLPTCLAFNSKFIAIGTQLGYILMYDLFEVLRQRLSTAKMDDVALRRRSLSITSLDLSGNGEAIIAGYVSGILLLWDAIKGVVLRSIADTHPSPISSVRFLTELKVVSVDTGGLVNKLTFTRNMIWSNYSVDTECLLDGTAGQILAMNVLSPYASVNPLVRPEAFEPVLRNLTLIALSSDRSSFAVAVDPVVQVLHRWARPASEKITTSIDNDDVGVGGASYYLPCLAWGWALTSGGQNVVMPILARSWGCCVQLLCTSFPTRNDDDNIVVAHNANGSNGKSSGDGGGGGSSGSGNSTTSSRESNHLSQHKSNSQQSIHLPAFGVHEEIDTSAPVVALEWLNDRSLVYLTVTNEFTVVDSVMMTMMERLDFSPLKLVYAEFSLSRSAHANGLSDGTTFQNSIRCSDGRMMVLCREELRCISIVTARRRITLLEEDGEWLEALALALDHYESTVVSQEDKKRDQSSRKDLSRHPEFAGATRSEEEEWIAKLLTRYINLAIDNAPERDFGTTSRGSQFKIDLAQSHFQMLAGVCVEFCVVTRRLDLLFGPIFWKFDSVGYSSVFLDVLQPYILGDKLNYIAPEVMVYFIEHCKATSGIASVERCLLHMDVRIMDFDTILLLLRTNEMYSALFYVFNEGLNDYITPLEILLDRVFDEADVGSAVRARNRGVKLQTTFEQLGYKAILYIQICFQGKTFPREKDLTPEDRKNAVKRDLLCFLTKEDYQRSRHFKSNHEKSLVGQRALIYPYMRVLLMVDPKEMLDTISIILDSAATASSPQTPDIQEVMSVLETIVLPTPGGLETLALESPGLVNAFLDFTSKYLLASSTILVNKEIVFMIICRMSDLFLLATDSNLREQAQRRVLELLSALPRDSYDPNKALELISRAGIHRAALLLHQQVAASWHEDQSKDIELRSQHFRCAIDCYLEDSDDSFRREVFDYIKKECSGVVDHSDTLHSKKPTSLRDALFVKLPAIVRLDALMTARLVAELFVDELDRVVEVLESDHNGLSLFKFLGAIISGELMECDPLAGSVLNLTVEHHFKYLALMAKLHPEMVYDYLSTHDNYRADECLKLCQEYDIADASAYLLERLGNVSSALQLILQTLESRLMNLKRSIRGMGSDMFRSSNLVSSTANQQKGSGIFHSLLPKSSHSSKDVDKTRHILTVALDLCERNCGSSVSQSDHGSELFFNVLDRLINAKGFLRLSKEHPVHAKAMAGVLSELLQLTMQRMVSCVPLTDLVRKVTSDHSQSRLSELREMVESLLGAYGFELQVFEDAIAIFRQDVDTMYQEHRRLQMEGRPVQAVLSASSLSEDSKKRTMEYNNAGTMKGRLDTVNPTLSAGKNRTVVLIDGVDELHSSRLANDDLTATLGKLRLRRQINNRFSGKNISFMRRGSIGPNMLTMEEQMYRAGEMEPVFYGARAVGALGVAEHRGRLMSFQ